MPSLTMSLQEMLFSQGFGTRRICSGLVEQGYVAYMQAGEWLNTHDPGQILAIEEAMPFEVQGAHWFYYSKAYLMLHKPTGTECSQKPSTWPSIYSLLPTPLRQRPVKSAVQGVQAVGRLDQDTTGLLLLTDDGQFIHRMSSPKHHVPKVYQVITENEMSATVCEKLSLGVVLNDDPKPVKGHDCKLIEPKHLELTLTEGKYHQVKRMLAAVGHHVVRLHRSRIGNLQLPTDLLPGQWRWLSAADIQQLWMKN